MKSGLKLVLGCLTVAVLVGAVFLLPDYPRGENPRGLLEIDVALSWVHESQFAGLYYADQHGFFKEEGLKVTFHPYAYEDLAQELVGGRYDFAILQADTLLLAREQGLPVKAIFADYRIIPTVYYSKKERDILKPADLVGKTVGVAYSERYPLIVMLENAGVNATKVNIVDRFYVYEPLADGTYDVEAGWVTDGDTVQAVAGDYNVMSPYDYGVNWYADLICVTEDTINENPEVVAAFLRATARGWQKAIENTEESALLTQRYDPNTEAEHLKSVLEVSSPLIHTGDSYIGWMEKGVFENTQQILVKQGVIKTPVDVEDVYTTQFLDGVYGGE